MGAFADVARALGVQGPEYCKILNKDPRDVVEGLKEYLLEQHDAQDKPAETPERGTTDNANRE
jgi:hypothetical protein